MATRINDVNKESALHRHIVNNKPAYIPVYAKYTHTVWGVSKEGNAIVHTEGRYHINKEPVPVYIKPNILNF